MSHFFANAGGGSGIEVLILGAVILASTIAYLIWLIKRKL